MNRDEILNSIKNEMPIDVKQINTDDLENPGLIIVDEVNGFCTPGAGNLAPPNHDSYVDGMIQKTIKLSNNFLNKNNPVMAFKDTHTPGIPEPPFPPHCERGTGEEELVSSLKFLEEDTNTAEVMEKDCINGFVGAIDNHMNTNRVVDWVNENSIKDLVVVGICTDICVMDFVLTMLSARNHGMMPTLENIYIDTKGTSTYDLPIETTQQLELPSTLSHPQGLTDYLGLYFMASRGAVIADVNNE